MDNFGLHEHSVLKSAGMKIKSLMWGFLFAFLISGCQQNNKAERIVDWKYLKVIREVRKEAFNYMTRNFTPGGSFAVMVKGKLVWSEGIGRASTDLEVRANRFTKYRMGQITQIMTSLAYHSMVEKGILNPGDTLRKYFPDYPDLKYKLKLHHLVEHTSGIRPANAKELNWHGLNPSILQSIDSFSKDTLLFEPGTYQFPSIYNYTLLGAVMEKSTGKPFREILRAWVTDTLDLENTVPDNLLITIKDRSNFYDRNLVSQTVNALPTDLRYRHPSDGYLTTAEDLVKLGQALMTSPVLSSQVREKMMTPPDLPVTSHYQMGNGLIFLKDMEGKDFYASRGNIDGSGAMLIILPNDEIVVGCLTNLSDDTDELPGLKIAFMFRDFLNGTFKKESENGETQEQEDPGEKEKPDK